jgi:signal transduction histidine kinase
MGRMLRVLLVEDSEEDAEIVERALRRGGIDPQLERVQTRASMIAALEKKAWDIVLSDYSMPQFNAPEAFRVLTEMGIDLPFIIVSGTVGEETAVAAMKLGVQDYLLKHNLVRLVPAVERELKERENRRKAAEALRKSEEKIMQMQKMESIGRLAGGVAHDFNNLLSIILSYSAMLSEGLDENDPMRADLDEISEAGRRAADLTRQLLAFSRQQVLQPRILDLDEIVAGMAKMLRRLIGEDVELEVKSTKELGRVEVDPGQMEQVLLNLAVNARDAMPRGGKLVIETRNVRVDDPVQGEVEAGDWVVLSVSDNGVGIDADARAHIFEPFFTTKARGKGTGLGLATVFGVVRQSGGQIVVKSEANKGTTFEVHLPRCDREATDTPSSPQGVITLAGSETILLVEDDDSVRSLTRTILQRGGYRVLDARAGDEALDLAAHHGGPIHLLLTDVVMPRMSGAQLAERLKATRAHVPVLFMSGYTDDSIVNHGVLAPGVQFVQKPLTPEGLLRKLREVLDGVRF